MTTLDHANPTHVSAASPALRARRAVRPAATRVLRVVVLALATTLALAAAHDILRARLLDAAYASGWTLFALAAWHELRRLRRVQAAQHPGRWMTGSAVAGAVAPALVLWHVGFRTPNGAMELTLLALCFATIASALAGAALARRGASERWLVLHVTLASGLLGLALVHAMTVHAHGLLAHVLLGK